MELETLSAKDRSAVVHKNHCARENLILTRNQGRIDRPLIRTGTQQRVLAQVPGDNLERNRKRKLKSRPRAELCDMDGPSTEATWEACENRPQAILRTDKMCLGGEYFGNGRSGGTGYKRKITVTRQIRSHGCHDELYNHSSRKEDSR